MPDSPAADHLGLDRRRFLQLGLLACVAPAVGSCAGTELVSPWSTHAALGLVAVHSAVMPDGLVLFFSYPRTDTDRLRDMVRLEGTYQYWDPQTRSPLPPEQLKGHNPFCAGHSILGDGRLFVAGGHNSGVTFQSSSSNRTYTIDSTRRWIRQENSAGDRWYPTCVTLENGDSLIIGGSDPAFATEGQDWNNVRREVDYFSLANSALVKTSDDLPEDRTGYPRDVRLRNTVTDGKNVAGLYPLAHLLPGGDLFVLTEVFARVYDRHTNRVIHRVEVGGFRTWPTQGSSVLLPIAVDRSGQAPSYVDIMVVSGGSTGEYEDPALRTATVYRYDRKTRALTRVQDVQLQRGRVMADSLLLPDGHVLVLGGADKGGANTSEGRHTAPEWIDTTELKSELLSSSSRDDGRGYHATSALLKDGAVVRAGGTKGWLAPGFACDDGCGPRNTQHIHGAPAEQYYDVEVFEPAYFRESRPVLTNVAQRLLPGQPLTVRCSGENIRPEIVLIRLASRTHSLDTDQRMLILEAEIGEGGTGEWTLTGRLPADSTILPPGPYYLFVRSAGSGGQITPSTAEILFSPP